MTALPHLVRPAELGDRAYVVDTWLHGYRQSHQGSVLPDEVYWSRFGHVGLVDHLLDVSLTAVVCLPGQPHFILGWVCHGGGLLHYMFVRLEFQRQRLGTLLYETAGKPTRVTHVTMQGSRLAHAMGVRPEYVNPYRETR